MSVPPRPAAEVPPPPRPGPAPVRPEVGLWLAVGCGYVLAGLVGLGLAALSPGVSVLWPPSGVALAAVVRLGWRALPGVAVGALVVNLINARPDAPLWGALGITAGNVAGAALGGWLATRGKRLRLDHLGGVGVLVLAAVLGSVPAALLGTAFVAAVGGDAPGDPLMTAVVWWTGDMAGVLLFVPLLLWPPVVGQDGTRGAVAWAGLLASAAFAAGFALTPGVPDPASLMACLPVVAIAAARYGPRGAAAANFVTAAVVVALLVADHKALGERLALVGFLAVSVVTALCLGIVTAERDAAETALSADIAARVAAEAQKARAEAALAADRSRFATLLAHSHDALVVMTRDGRTAYVTDAITAMCGRTPAELAGRSTFENVHPDDRTLVQLTFADTLAHPGLPTKAEFRIQRTDGRWVWLEALATNHLDNPAVAGVVVNIRDVTDRREVEAQFRETRALLETTAGLARIGGWEYHIPENRITWSQQTYRIHELSPFEYAPHPDNSLDFYAPEGREVMREMGARAAATGEGWDVVLPFVTARGNKLWVHVIGQLETRGGKPHRLYGTIQDVTERVEAERAVERSEDRYRNLFEAAPVAIWEEDMTGVADWFGGLRAAGVTDLAAHLAAHPHLAAAAIGMIRVRNVNQAAVAMNRAADKAELMASLPKLIGPETGPAFARELVGLWSGERALRIETRAVRLTGEPADIVLHVGVPNAGGRPDLSRVVVLAVDVTDQKRLEEQFRQAQKLEAVARLAGGIAHDFNNLLTVINGFSELIAAETPPGSPLRPLVTHIQSAGERGADLTRQLLAFSRKQPPAAGPVDLAAVVESLRPLLAPLIGEEVALVTRVAAVPKVLADRGQMESVVMNLCVNARDAMPGGGTLTVETGVTEVAEAQSPDDPPPGRWVVLSVGDTGTGIPEEVRPHLFEPFFTTKELGKGTGLGLSTVYGIAATAGGHIRFTTATDCGTTFRIYLPAAGAAAGFFPPPGRDGPARPRAADGPPPRVAAFADAPLVLLVEDQPAIRELSARVLTETGFEVLAACDGIEALSVLADLSRPPAVLVTDVRMPNMTGRDLADRVRLKHPEIKVLFISGDTEEVSGPNEAFLAKPFNIDELTDAVIGVLGAPVPQPAAG
ncbi:PAS domain S-box protein [Gemmata sp.]|uniref:PAS domain S-box protein n=1 Tax=Gemmata sp. TaxID=1914242 RepID=UPI003F6F3DA5